MSQTHRDHTLHSSLRRVWQRTQNKHMSGAFFALLSWGISLFLLGMGIDRIAYLPTAGRAVMLAIIVGVSLYKAWQKGLQHLQKFNATNTALEVEKHEGGLDSILVTGVQMASTTPSSKSSEAMYEAIRKKAEGAAGKLKPSEIVTFKSLQGPMNLAIAFGSFLFVLIVINGPFIAVGFSRIFTPWSQVPYPTQTQLVLPEGDLIVKEGDSAEIVVGVSGVIPRQGLLYLRTGEGKPRKLELEISEDQFAYKIASASRGFSYRVKAGDARSDWLQVRVVNAPRIENVQVGLEFPEYLDRDAEKVEALTLTVPQDTKLNLQLTLDRPLQKAALHRDGKKEPLPLTLSEDGLQVSIQELGDASRGYHFTWVDRDYGYEFTSPRYYLQVSSDQAPRVELTSPESNLLAMIGRPLELAARIQDDHGIGSTMVIYRVNQRDEAGVEFQFSESDGSGEQPVDWDYRESLPDLKIGDTLTITLEVSDQYPGENGAHVVRSDTRRMTFLSKEDYLEQIQKQRDRLLSRVQATYRQQRAAFDSVSELDPKGDGYLQACQVEAIRQELLRDQLKGIAGQLQHLLDDLAANNVSDAEEGDSLDHIRQALLSIADTHLANAAVLLRYQSGIAGGDSEEKPNPAFAASAVNTAARELASLVLLRSIDAAQEVFAREIRMLANVQASLRWHNVSLKGVESRTSLSKEQLELANWTNRLLRDIENGMRYGRRPLAILRLIRSVKGLRAARMEGRMKEAAELIQQNEVANAEALQAQLVADLLDAEFGVRLSGAYTTLIKTRDKIRLLLQAQGLLRKQSADLSPEEFRKKAKATQETQTQLHQRLLTLLLQSVPVPRTQLFDETLPEVPPVLNLLKEADLAMAKAIEQLAAGEKVQAIEQQQKVESALTQLVGLVDRWSVQLGLETLGLGTLVAATGERLGIIEDFEARVIALLEKTDIAAADGQKVSGLAENQLVQAEEMADFNNDLRKQHQSNPDQDIPPLISRTQRAEQALRNAVKSLEANVADQSIGHQEQAADILSEALAIVTTQNEQLGLLQSLLMYQRSVRFANGYMSDLVAQQWDLAKATEALEETDDPSVLYPLLGNLRRCVHEIAPLLDLVASRLDAGSPLAFTASDLEDAVAALKDGDSLDAFDAQEVAAESLEEVHGLVKAVNSQTGYIAEIVEFLHKSVSDISMLEYQQDELTRKALKAKPEDLNALLAKQNELLVKAEKVGQLLVEVTGMEAFAESAEVMREIVATIESKDAVATAENMELAEALLLENAESLFLVISMLHGLPNIDVLAHKESEAVERLVEVMAVATSHKMLFRQTNSSEPDVIKSLAGQQGKLAARCRELSQTGESHELLNQASSQLEAAAKAMQSSDRESIKTSQKLAMHTLRHFIIDQALVLETATPPTVASDGEENAGGEGSDGESAFSAGFIADFVSGEAPKEQRSEWKVRGERNRASLNQNFARELPLEYRGLLKDYYERVAK